jgi:RNA polymerase sigma factor (sigma-70 family)
MLNEEKIINLYRELGKELYVYLFRLVGNIEHAEDILHDVFVNLITYSRKKEVREETVRAFLYRTAHNLAVNHIKKTKLIKMTPLHENLTFSESGDPDESMELKEIRKAVDKVLSGIDPVARSIFIMKKELNLKIPEIAEKTGLSERTVKRRLQMISRRLAGEIRKSGFISLIIILLALFACWIVDKV